MLSDRQFQLIHAVIDEYIKNAEPVGSVEIVAKYNLRCSPATIRNEMAKLIDLGFLESVLDNAAAQGDIKTLIEEEVGIEKLNKCAMVFTDYSAGKRSGKIGVFGPSRISYPEIIPSVKYTKRLIEELGGS